jgi:hypothetical protein
LISDCGRVYIIVSALMNFIYVLFLHINLIRLNILYSTYNQ